MNERRLYLFEFQSQFPSFLPLIMSAVTQSIYMPGTLTFHASSTIALHLSKPVPAPQSTSRQSSTTSTHSAALGKEV